ncbi:MAG TPA: selenium-dependent molybdenum cofactor biosynthesis protein YqeB [Candidatus Limiplasma sp.]|nr:selenium-dependent molybdenum cofactor biosynthesis protein YqeB [Candidatus Limiplasma sp.]HPS80501.1 selenium-dependent molybdenum cofactor biosynthesis protein YqeB [Candidatus Limiplasma sp.]
MLVVIKGAGDLASGVAVRLKRAGIKLVMTEIAHPTAIRRTVSFCRAVWEGRAEVEGIEARLATDAAEALTIADGCGIAVLVDPAMQSLTEIKPNALVDATLMKHNVNTHITDAPIVIALGPGFTAGVDCHAVVETMRGHDLGRVLTAGAALADTGIPGDIAGYAEERILRSPCDGVWQTAKSIGAHVEVGEVVATVGCEAVRSTLHGVLRGLLPTGTPVRRGMKSGDVDPRDKAEYCATVSDKARAIGGGVLEALLMFSGGVPNGK